MIKIGIIRYDKMGQIRAGAINASKSVEVKYICEKSDKINSQDYKVVDNKKNNN